MIVVGSIEDESNIRSVVLLHRKAELMEGSLVMWTLGHAGVDGLFLRRK
jgi:hypothetical protein